MWGRSSASSRLTRVTPGSVTAALRLLAALTCLFLGSCSLGASSRPASLPADRQVLRIGLVTGGYDLNTLDPAQSAVQNPSGFISSLIFPPLLTDDAHLNVEPWAAAAMPTFDAATNTYTLHIRPSLRWSDGTPITAATYAYSLNRSLSPCTGSGTAYYLFALRDAQAFSTETCKGTAIHGKLQTLVGDALLVPDPQTLLLKLTAPAPYLLQALTTPVAEAQPEQLITRYGQHDWITHLPDNGGFGGNLYRVTSWDHHGHLDLTACLASCGAPVVAGWGGHHSAPHLRHLSFTFYPTPSAEEADQQAGSLDIASYASAADRVAGRGMTWVAVPTLELTYLQPNWAAAPFDDLRARQAFALALNKQALARELGLLPTNHIVPLGMAGYNSELLGPDATTSTTGNVPLARALLQSYADDQCGGQFSHCPPVVVAAGFLPCSVSIDPATIAFEHSVAKMWQQAFPGYPITVYSSVGGCSLLSLIYTVHMPPVMDAGWFADYPDPEDWLSLQFGPAAINNVATVELPVANTLMNEADQELDPAVRTALYSQAEQLLVQNVAWIPVGQSLTYFDVRTSVAGFGVTALGEPSLDQVYELQLMKS